MRDHKLIRMFIKAPLMQGASINLDKSQSHYLITVMRRKISDSVLIFNGHDGEFEATITSDSKSSAVLDVIKKTKEQHSSPNLTLLYAPVKNAKNEFIIQKATEMGASAIQPVITQHTIKDKINIERLLLVAIEAAEQCERLDIPDVNEIDVLEKILPKYNDHKIILCDETGAGKSASEVFSELKLTCQNNENDKFAILIGPEGGFSDAEIKTLHAQKNVFAIGLGPRILRAETAIIAALALWQNYLGDFNQKPDFRG